MKHDVIGRLIREVLNSRGIRNSSSSVLTQHVILETFNFSLVSEIFKVFLTNQPVLYVKHYFIVFLEMLTDNFLKCSNNGLTMVLPV